MAIDIRQREFIFTLGGAAAAWPFAARSQQAAMPVIGFLSSGSPNALVDLVGAFHLGLNEAGYVERRNVGIDIAGRRVNTIDYLLWPPIWFVVR